MNLRGWVLGFAALCLLVPAVESTAAVSMGDLQRQAQQMRELDVVMGALAQDPSQLGRIPRSVTRVHL